MNSENEEAEVGAGPARMIGIADLVGVLLLRRRLIILGTIGTVAATILAIVVGALMPPATSFLPAVYEPKATMLIGAPESGGLESALSSSGLGSLAGIAGLTGASNSNSELALYLLHSNSTLDELNTRFGLTKRYRIKKFAQVETRQEITKRLTGTIDSASSIFTISFVDIDPVFARDLLNVTVQILERRFAELRGTKATLQKDILENKLLEVRVSIAELEEAVKAFQRKYKVSNVEALATEQVSVLARLRSELILKEIEIDNYSRLSTLDDPVRQRLKGERESILSKIREIEGGGGISGQDKVMPSQRELPELAFEYAKLQRDLLVQTEVYKMLVQQYEITKLKTAGQEPVFQILDLAEVLEQKTGPARTKITILAGGLGFVAFVLLAYFLEAIERFKRDENEMEKLRAYAARKRP